MTSRRLLEEVREHITGLESWAEQNRFRGYEPFDGLSSPFARLTFGDLFLERVLQQIVRRVPWNIRPLLWISKKDSTKGRGYFAWGALTLLGLLDDTQHRKLAGECLDWLIENPSPHYDEFSWGNHFPFSSRIGKLPAHEPIVVWTSLIGCALLKGHKELGEERYLIAARSVGRWIMDLPKERTESGDCISYVRFEQRSIHNANMLGAGFLARLGMLENDNQMLAVAKEGIRYSCTRIREDGSWWYGEEEKFQWIDNFHTGYNLDSLRRYIEATGDEEYLPVLKSGLEYYLNHFFTEEGAPKYYSESLYPIDSQAVAQSIETLTMFADFDHRASDLAHKVVRWTLDHLVSRTGRFYFRVNRFSKNRIPMMHWTQAVMYRAMAVFYRRFQSEMESS